MGKGVANLWRYWQVATAAKVLAGEHAIAGFRNRDLVRRLHPRPPTNPAESRRRCARTCRLIAKLRAHGLVVKIHNTRRYRTTCYSGGNRVVPLASTTVDASSCRLVHPYLA